ncbi:MAG: YchF/TatD family DNA exonuclease [Deltaproteobacteria bacterium]|nr:YchF/TatD family DNA exonuclease [Deltaproteobacteria bacterium]
MSANQSNPQYLIDTHAHLDDPKFEKDIDDVIKRAKDAGLEHIITVGCLREKTGLKKIIELTEKYEMVYAALGIHPHDAKDISPSPFPLPYGERGMFLDEIKELTKKNKVVAIGETGLDYYYEHSPKNIQKDVFIKQINIARELKLPLIIHSREAQNDTLDILKQENVRDIGGVVHCFSGTYEMAKKILDMGLYISFTGVATFPKAENIHELVRKIPIEMLLVETDCPYLAPEPHRWKRNEPSYVKFVAERLAELKKLSYGDAARITTLNAKKLFSIGINKPEAKIAYPIRNSLYLNITNRCTNICTFCAKHAPAGFKRGSNDYTVKGHYLKLNAEPSPQEILRAIGPNPTKYDEIVFCGFGEPLIRLDVVKEVGLLLKKMGCKIRIDTDGLANLVHGKNCLPELMFADVISVSMNAPDSETYQKLIKTPFKDKAFPAILWFLKEAKRYIPKVVATVVAAPGLDIEACKRLAEDEIGVGFRIREYNVVG